MEQAIDYARRAVPQLEPQTPIKPPQWVNNQHRAELWLRMVFSELVDEDFQLPVVLEPPVGLVARNGLLDASRASPQ